MELIGGSHRAVCEEEGGGGIQGNSKKHVGEIKDQHNGTTLVGQSVMISRTKAQAKRQKSLQ